MLVCLYSPGFVLIRFDFTTSHDVVFPVQFTNSRFGHWHHSHAISYSSLPGDETSERHLGLQRPRSDWIHPPEGWVITCRTFDFTYEDFSIRRAVLYYVFTLTFLPILFVHYTCIRHIKLTYERSRSIRSSLFSILERENWRYQGIFRPTSFSSVPGQI